jgi:DNA repair protein RecO (recombination protein O)
MDAIVLKSIPYEDDGKILKLFTESHGIISVVVKKLQSKASYLQTLTSPLSRGEFHLNKRQSDLYTFKEGSLTDGYYELRNDLQKLDAACIILKSILKSQFLEKPSEPLFFLTTSYLKKLKSFEKPIVLALSFQLKVLNYEGLYPENNEELQNPFSKQEWLSIECMCHAKKFELLEKIEVDGELELKIKTLFDERFADYS